MLFLGARGARELENRLTSFGYTSIGSLNLNDMKSEEKGSKNTTIFVFIAFLTNFQNCVFLLHFKFICHLLSVP